MDSLLDLECGPLAPIINKSGISHRSGGFGGVWRAILELVKL